MGWDSGRNPLARSMMARSVPRGLSTPYPMYKHHHIMYVRCAVDRHINDATRRSTKHTTQANMSVSIRKSHQNMTRRQRLWGDK